MFDSIFEKLFSRMKTHNHINGSIDSHPTSKIFSSKVNGDLNLKSNTRVESAIISGTVNIDSSSQIIESKLKGHIVIGKECKINRASLYGSITIGDYSTLWGPNIDVFSGNQKIEIGNFCSIAKQVSFQAYNHNHHKITTYFIGKNLFKENWDDETVSKGDIIIGSDVWIGAQCFIGSGISIGHGAVIAANTTVIKDVPPYTIVGGSPARVIGSRFSEEEITVLLQLKWWEWEEEKIKLNRDLFVSDKLDLKKLSNIK